MLHYRRHAGAGGSAHHPSRPQGTYLSRPHWLAFIEDQVDGTQIGVVAFADFAELVVPPTTDRPVLRAGVENLTTALGTAIGSATLEAIDAIAAINPEIAPSGLNLHGGEINPAPDAGYQPDVIVLLTDGAISRGPRSLDSVLQAADRRIRIYTIGFGTEDPGRMVCTRAQMGGDAYGGGFGGGFGGGSFGGGGNFRRFLVIDEETLQAVAALTGGEYYRAESADQLYQVFLDLPAQIELQEQAVEISVILTALGAVLATVAVALSLWWHR
ncbi:MAG: VWA domain-containing protein [Anaerolineae bacterium]|nr:VWA domain-containing protein [Anaerolineae bacterium]